MNEKKTVLIADDEMLKLLTLKTQLTRAGFEVVTATDGHAALEALHRERVDAVVTDVRMPGLDGLTLLERSKELDPSRPVLVMTGYGAVEDAVRAMRLGAVDYLMKPVSADEIQVRLERALSISEMGTECQKLREELERLGGPSEPIYTSEKMRAVFDKLKRAAQTDATVLLVGETGSGKEVCARYLHDMSRRRSSPFVSVSCAALAPGVVESELFGHEKGSFTGATSRREGRLSVARGGTLFLDDVDDIPLEVQAKLLGVLENSTYERVGGTDQIKADVRFVAATKKNLEGLVAAGKFRDDLMYRLKVVQLELPPLRERREDIEPLALHFLGRSLTRMGRPSKTIQEEALEAIRKHSWPGNVRELEHLIESLVAIHEGDEITLDDLPEKIGGSGSRELFVLHTDGRESIDYQQAMQSFERRLLAWALDQAQGNQVKAAQLINLPRSTFNYRWTKLKEEDDGQS